MILILLMGIGVVTGLLSGGSLRNLASLRLRHVWLPLVAFALQAVFVSLVGEARPIPVWLRFFVLAITSALVFAFLLVNAHLPGRRLLLAGAALNAAVMLANGGLMPVTPEALARAGHTGYLFNVGDDQFVHRSKDLVLEREDTRLWFLSDVLGIPAQLPFSGNFSPGDLLIGLGAAWLIHRGLTLGSSPRRADAEPPCDSAVPRRKAHASWEREAGNGVRGDARDDRQSTDGPQVPGRPAAQPGGGHARSPAHGEGA